MPAVDWDVSNYIHNVAPEIQHSRGNWKIEDGEDVSAGQEIFSLQYEELSRGGTLKFLFDSIFQTLHRAEFRLHAPISGRYHVKGFYSRSSREDHLDQLTDKVMNRSIFLLSYAFHAFTDEKRTIFPYEFYKPWFDCVEKNRSWIDSELAGDQYYGNPDWYQIIISEKERFKNLPCPVISHERYLDWLRLSWGNDPNRPAWLDR